MRRKIGIISMILGAALILAALSLFLWNRWEDRQASVSVEEILPQVEVAIEEAAAKETENGGTVMYELSGSDSGDMTEAEIDGYNYIGYISIPALGLELPVMSSWSYEQLRIAPCRYYGSIATGDLVIAAHNYSRHFKNIQRLTAGDEVLFTDMDGIVTIYTVAEVETLTPESVEEMTDSGYALTLFTCTYGGQNRVTVRCNIMKEN